MFSSTIVRNVLAVSDLPTKPIPSRRALKNFSSTPACWSTRSSPPRTDARIAAIEREFGRTRATRGEDRTCDPPSTCSCTTNRVEKSRVHGAHPYMTQRAFRDDFHWCRSGPGPVHPSTT
jgi:7,8-dihydro-6-hydroxymethylpterin-pyrophosphokinase